MPPDDEADPDELTRNPAVALFLARARGQPPRDRGDPDERRPRGDDLPPARRHPARDRARCRRAAGPRAAPAHRPARGPDRRDRRGEVRASTPAATHGRPPARRASAACGRRWTGASACCPSRSSASTGGSSVISGTFGSPTAAAILDGGERRGLAPLGIERRGRPPPAGRRLAPAARGRRPRVRDAHDGARRRAGPARTERRGRRDALGPRLPGARASPRRPSARCPPTARSRPSTGWTRRTTTSASRWSGRWSRATGRSRSGSRGRWPSSGGRAATTRRVGSASRRRCRWPSTRRRPSVRKALSGAGLLASYQGDYRLGEAYLREALSIAREMGDEEARRSCLNWLGTNAYASGDLDAAEAFVSESARDPPPDRRAGRDRAGAQRAGRRPPLPRRPRPRPRDVRREPRRSRRASATRTGSRSR